MIHKIAVLSDPFARVAKAVLDDKRISWKAKGVFAYLMGKPDNWQGVVADVVNHGTDKETAVRAAMAELEKYGYAKQERVRKGGRMAGLVWHVTDDPTYFTRENKGDSPRSENLNVEKTNVEKPESENPPHNKIELQEVGTESALAVSIADSLYQLYPRKIGKPAAIKAILKALKKTDPDTLRKAVTAFAKAREGTDLEFCPHPATWFNQERFNDDPSTWLRRKESDVPYVRGTRPPPATVPQGSAWNRERFRQKIGLQPTEQQRAA